MNHIPESELEIDFVRSSGPGGQNVNKTSTKAQLRWHLWSSIAFSDEEKQILAAKLANRLTQEGFIAIDSSEARSQPQNRDRAITLLYELINEALAPQTPRIPTNPPRITKLQRLNSKRKRGTIKQLRRPVVED